MKFTFVLLLCACFLASPTFAQVELNSSGNVGIGGVAPSSSYTLTIDSNESTGLHVTTGNTTSLMAGIRTQSYYGSNNYGLVSYAREGTKNYGVYTYAVKATGTTKAYGIFAKVDQADSNENSYGGYFDVVGSGSGTSYAGYFNGDVHITGDLNGSPPSDMKFKENIAPLDRAAFVQRLMQLRPVSFTFKKSEEFDAINLSDGLQYGLTAQEVETVFPEFVSDHVHPGATDEEGVDIGEPISYKAISYMKLIPLLLSAVQEQQAEIDALKSALSSNGISVNR